MRIHSQPSLSVRLRRAKPQTYSRTVTQPGTITHTRTHTHTHSSHATIAGKPFPFMLLSAFGCIGWLGCPYASIQTTVTTRTHSHSHSHSLTYSFVHAHSSRIGMGIRKKLESLIPEAENGVYVYQRPDITDRRTTNVKERRQRRRCEKWRKSAELGNRSKCVSVCVCVQEMAVEYECGCHMTL